MNWKVPRMWEGGDVWILGGGPSVTEQFEIPQELVSKVKAGQAPLSVFSPYMAAIHMKHVIGINVAFMIGNWIDIVFFGDNGFFLRFKQQLSEFPGLKTSCNPNSNRTPWVKNFVRDVSHPKGISMKPGHVSWNYNSGAASISIAAQAGAKRIMLLGFDMKLADDKFQHFHDVYVRGPVSDERRARKLPFTRHLRGFDAMAEDAKALGIEIINVSPNSAITQFRKVGLKEFLNECN
jgi:hypothetical protein